ncbi:hypothetical protein Nm8I071_38220 [Nonomuraea sp. TT08I-71]|nr:hypothetical protein Nm8I071_38220 [Nonomuraea sp. TT08I-71]
MPIRLAPAAGMTGAEGAAIGASVRPPPPGRTGNQVNAGVLRAVRTITDMAQLEACGVCVASVYGLVGAQVGS